MTTNRDDRFDKEAGRAKDFRTAAQIDRDRILYSPHFARLAEVTQVRSFSGDFIVHNRLTHSLKVAQVARRIAEVLIQRQYDLAMRCGLDPDVAEAAGLAHDLGHPPFGHIAEERLNELVQTQAGNRNLKAEGFEGNAQSFRIVTKLSVSDAAPEEDAGVARAHDFVAGLNLTRATLEAILKYPWFYQENERKLNKWGSYKTEESVFNWARQNTKNQVRSVEAEIMDWADDITYAIHDMIDFYCAGLIPLHLLATQSGGDLAKREWARFFDSTCEKTEDEKIRNDRSKFEGALRDALSLAGLDGPFDGSQQQSTTIWRFSSELISRCVAAIKLKPQTESQEGPYTEIGGAAKDQTTILKQLTWHYVIRRSDLATLQYGQQAMIESLFKTFEKAVRTERWEMFPVGFAQLIKSDETITSPRWAADYISGLTERRVYELFQRIQGRSD